MDILEGLSSFVSICCGRACSHILKVPLLNQANEDEGGCVCVCVCVRDIADLPMLLPFCVGIRVCKVVRLPAVEGHHGLHL